MSITLTKAIGENFLQYPQLEIPLENQGLVFLGGEMEHHRARSNGCGKTSAMSLTPWIIWGEILRDMKDVSRVIRYDSKLCLGRLEGRIENEPFWIERMRTAKGVEIKTSFAGSSRARDIQQEILEVFRPFDLAQNTVFLAQRKALEFLSATDSDRRRILEDLLKIGIWHEAQNRVKPDLVWAEEAYKKFDFEHKQAETNLQLLMREIEHAQTVATSDLQAQVRMLEEQLSEKQEVVSKLRSALGAFQEYAEKKIETWKKIDLEYHKATIKAATDEREHNTTYQKWCQLVKTQNSFQSGVCPTCNRQLDTKIDLTVDINNAVSSVNFTASSLEESKKLVAKIKPELDEAAQAKSNALIKIMDTKTLLQDAEGSVNNLLSKIQSLNSEIELVKMTEEADHSEDIEKLRWVITSRSNMQIELTAGIKAMNFWKDAFGYKGIPSMLIAESLPLLVQKTNDALVELSDGEMEIDISPADVAKDGRLLERLTIVVWKHGRWVYLEDCSSGEQRRIVISLFLALSSIQKLLTNTAWNIRLIDELFDTLDYPGVERVMRLLRKLVDSGEVNTVIISSHRAEIGNLDAIDHVWTARRNREGSHLLVPELCTSLCG